MSQEPDRDAFVQLSDELWAVLGPEGTLHELGPAWSRSLGWSVEQLEARALSDLVHRDDREAAQQLLLELAAGRPVHDLELRLGHRDDGHRWVRCRAAPHPGGSLGYLVGQDVTEAQRDRAARQLLEQQARVGTWELDPGTGRAVWSATTHELHGTDPSQVEESVAMGLARYPPGARERIAAAFGRLAATGEGYDLELPYLLPEGGERLIRTVGRAVQRDGVVVRAYGTLEDITERVAHQHQRAELTRAQQLLEESQRLARLAHWEGDVLTGKLTWSPLVYELVGVDADSFSPTRDSFRALIHPDDRESVSAAALRTLSEGRQMVDYRVCRPDGQVRNVRQLIRIAADAGDPPTRLFGTIQDITELRQVEQALRDNQELLQRVLAATNDGWWDLDLVTGSSFYSDRWWELCGYAPGELPAGPDTWRQLTHPDDLARHAAGFEAVMASGARTYVLPSGGLHRDGHRVPMVVRGLIDYDEQGHPVRISGTTTDVTEARQAEVAKEEFISNVSHELRTPLTSIGGALETLAAGVVGELSEPAATLVEVAQRNTRRLRLLIDDLLDLERLLTDRQPFDRVTQPLTPLLAEAVADNEPYAAMHGVRLVLRAPVDEVLVTVDHARLAQVLANYLSNAAKFAPRDSDVEVRLRPDLDTSSRIRVEVVDRGPGVPTELQAHIFERFVQGDAADPRSRGGTGLGLAISREIVERHGGRTGVESRPGRTCVWFDLPLAGAGD